MAVLGVIAFLALILSFWQVRAADKSGQSDALDSTTHIPIGAVIGIVGAALYVGRRIMTWETAMSDAMAATKKIGTLEAQMTRLEGLLTSRPCFLPGVNPPHCPSTDLTERQGPNSLLPH